MSELFVPDRPLHAVVGVELFDAETGRKLDESKGENYITPAGVAHNRWKVRNDYMASMPGAGNTDVEPVNPFGEVWMSPSTEAIDTADNWPKGLTVAWANKWTYAGADTFRGSPNSLESLADATRAKWVFDWPTTAGNGTINSVGWRPGWGSQTLTFRLTVNTGYNGYTQVACNSGNRIFVGGAATLGVLDYSAPATFDAAFTTATLGFTPTLLACGPTHMFGVSGATIYRWAIPTDGSAITKTSFSVAGVTSIAGIAHDGTMLWVASATDKTVYRVNDSTGAVDRSFSVPTQCEKISYNPKEDTLFLQYNSSALQDQYDMNGVLVGKFNTQYAGTWVRPQTMWLDGGVRGLQGHSNASSSLLLDIEIGSRVLLPSPVVKSSLQTMKLTYTFTYA